MHIPFFRREVSVCCFVVGLQLAAITLLLVGGTTFYLARSPLLRAFGQWWVVDESPIKADAVVVLSGDSIDGTRVRRAVEIYQQGWAPRILLSGPLMRPNLSEGVFMVQDAKRFGAPESALEIIESKADSTLEESDEILDYAAKRNCYHLLVVTSDYHARRTRTIYAVESKKRGVAVRIISAPQFLVGRQRWWENRQARKGLINEFVKFPVTLWEIRHPNPPGSPPDDD
jgi:uncharacterized SAM-binding protein YcdF (DUF218 family)